MHSKALLFTRLAAQHKDSVYWQKLHEKYEKDLPTNATDIAIAEAVLAKAEDKKAVQEEMKVNKWGMIASSWHERDPGKGR